MLKSFATDMETRNQVIEQFFTTYEQQFNDALAGKKPDIDTTVNSFTDCFIESSPLGTLCGKNDRSLKGKIRDGFEFYKRIGTQSMNIVSADINNLDDFHAMAKVNWHYKAIREKDREEVVIDFSVIYFLQILDEQVKIFAYITGDEQKSLKEHGLLD